MATDQGAQRRGFSRRQFLTLAGAGALVGALIFAATRGKGVQGLIKSVTNAPANRATAGKVIQTTAPAAGPSLLTRLLGGKL